MTEPTVAHVIPEDDTLHHEAGLNTTCPCGPHIEAVMRADGTCGWTYLHHALDAQPGGTR